MFDSGLTNELDPTGIFAERRLASSPEGHPATEALMVTVATGWRARPDVGSGLIRACDPDPETGVEVVGRDAAEVIRRVRGIVRDRVGPKMEPSGTGPRRSQ